MLGREVPLRFSGKPAVPSEPEISTARRWQARSEPQLLWRTWGSECVAFDPLSGDTHFFDLVARAGLECLMESALSEQEVCERLAQRLESQSDEALRIYVARLLARLEELGLIESIES